MSNPAVMEKPESQPMSVERTHERVAFVPYTDIYENEDALILIMDMPGVDEKSLDVQLEKELLTIKGRAEDPKLEPGYRQLYTEYRYGDYERSFTVSEKVDSDKIEATVKDGVLRLTLPKSKKSAKVKKIAVKNE